MSEITRLRADASVDKICEHLELDAAVIVEDVLPDSLLDAIRSEVDPYLDACDGGKDKFKGVATKRIGALVARSPASREVVLNEFVNRSAAKFLAPFANGHQLLLAQASSIGPGEKAQALHRDRGAWGNYLPRNLETHLNTVWAISECTADNGATQVVPGSHKWDEDREAEPHEVLRAEMRPGSVLIYSGSVIHGGGANVTNDEHRLALLIQYTLNWLRQQENQYLSCPPDIAKTLSPELQKLVGYTRAGPVLGFYSTPGEPGEGFEIADPIKALT